MVKNLFQLLLIFLLVALGLSSGQTNDSLKLSKKPVKFSIHSGYEYNDFKELKASFNEVKASLRSLGINMADKPVYPYSFVMGGSILFTANGEFFFGVKFERTETKASSSYEDMTGSAELASTINTIKFCLVSQVVVTRISEYFSPTLDMNLGFLYVDYEFNSKITSVLPSKGSSSETLTANGRTFTGSALLGIQHKIYKGIILFEKAGLQIADIHNLDAKVGELKTRINFQGFIFQMGLGFQL